VRSGQQRYFLHTHGAQFRATVRHSAWDNGRIWRNSSSATVDVRPSKSEPGRNRDNPIFRITATNAAASGAVVFAVMASDISNIT
jgi:hypothetical protein